MNIETITNHHIAFYRLQRSFLSGNIAVALRNFAPPRIIVHAGGITRGWEREGRRVKMGSPIMAPFVHAPLSGPRSPFLAVRQAGGAARSPLAALAADDFRARPSPSANARALQALS